MSAGNFLFDPNQLLWVEKYRPQRVVDCIVPDRIKSPLMKIIETDDMPNLLFSGTAGIGKTTLAKALCNDMGIDWILLNASNERGIDVLRTTITNFATTVSLSETDKPKVIILDEFDGASPILQSAMRSAVEDFSKNCRFIFTCNFPNRIIDALHSRCSAISMSMTKEEKPEMATQMLKRIEQILKNENVQFDRKAIASVIQKYFPDFRRTLNELQKLSKASDKIDIELVESNSDEMNIGKLAKCLREKDFGAMRNWVVQHSGNDFNVMFRKIYDGLSDLLQPASIPEAVLIVANYQYRGTTAPDPEVNLVACLTEIMAACEFKGK